jgi:hypothetical protein
MDCRQACQLAKGHDICSPFSGGGSGQPKKRTAAFGDFVLRQVKGAALCKGGFHIRRSISSHEWLIVLVLHTAGLPIT